MCGGPKTRLVLQHADHAAAAAAVGGRRADAGRAAAADVAASAGERP